MVGMCQSYAARRLHFSLVSFFKGDAFPLITRNIHASGDAATATGPCAKKCQQSQGMIVFLQRHNHTSAARSDKKRGWLIPNILNLLVPCPLWFLRV